MISERQSSQTALTAAAQSDIGGQEMWRRTDSLRPAELSRLAHAVLG